MRRSRPWAARLALERKYPSDELLEPLGSVVRCRNYRTGCGRDWGRPDRGLGRGARRSRRFGSRICTRASRICTRASRIRTEAGRICTRGGCA